MFAITVSSFAKVSIPAFPASLIPFASFILLIIFLLFSFVKNALHVIVLVPSYTAILKSIFPPFSSLSSIDITSPSIATFPDSTPKSCIFTNGSFISGCIPKINGESSSSVGSFGKSSPFTSNIVFAIIVTSPANESSPAFPIVFIPLAFFILFATSFPSSIFLVNDLQVIIPVPSYISYTSIPLPVLVSLAVHSTTLPSIVILLLLASISFIFTLHSFAFEAVPNIILFASSISSNSERYASSGTGTSSPKNSSPATPVCSIFSFTGLFCSILFSSTCFISSCKCFISSSSCFFAYSCCTLICSSDIFSIKLTFNFLPYILNRKLDNVSSIFFAVKKSFPFIKSITFA